MLKIIPSREVWYYDRTGERRKIHGLSLPARSKFLKLQKLLLEHFDPDLPFDVQYDENSLVRSIVDDCLDLYGLCPEWLGMGDLVRLFFAYGTEPGILFQLEFSKSQKQGKLLDCESDPYHQAIAVLWSLNPDRCLNEILESVLCLPQTDLEEILSARQKIEEQRGEDGKQSDVEGLREFSRDVASGALFDVGEKLDLNLSPTQLQSIQDLVGNGR